MPSNAKRPHPSSQMQPGPTPYNSQHQWYPPQAANRMWTNQATYDSSESTMSFQHQAAPMNPVPYMDTNLIQQFQQVYQDMQKMVEHVNAQMTKLTTTKESSPQLSNSQGAELINLQTGIPAIKELLLTMNSTVLCPHCDNKFMVITDLQYPEVPSGSIGTASAMSQSEVIRKRYVQLAKNQFVEMLNKFDAELSATSFGFHPKMYNSRSLKKVDFSMGTNVPWISLWFVEMTSSHLHCTHRLFEFYTFIAKFPGDVQTLMKHFRAKLTPFVEIVHVDVENVERNGQSFGLTGRGVIRLLSFIAPPLLDPEPIQKLMEIVCNIIKESVVWMIKSDAKADNGSKVAEGIKEVELTSSSVLPTNNKMVDLQVLSDVASSLVPKQIPSNTMIKTRGQRRLELQQMRQQKVAEKEDHVDIVSESSH